MIEQNKFSKEIEDEYKIDNNVPEKFNSSVLDEIHDRTLDLDDEEA